MVHDRAKARSAACTLGDVGVAVLSASHRPDRIVEVETVQTVEPAHIIPFLEDGSGLCVGRHVVPRGGDMAGIKAEAHPFGFLHPFAEVLEVVKGVAEIRARADGGLEAGDDPKAGQIGVKLIERGDDAVEAGPLILVRLGGEIVRLLRRARQAEMRAGMRNEQGNVERFTPLHLIALEVDGFGARRLVGRSHVDEVRVVADDARLLFARGPVHRAEFIQPGLSVFLGERFHVPLALVLGEDLHAVELELARARERVDHAAGDGEVGTEHAGMVGERRGDRILSGKVAFTARRTETASCNRHAVVHCL